MKKLLLAALITASFAAQAHDEMPPPFTVIVPVTTSHASSAANQSQHQAQHQSQKQKQHQNSNSTSTANSPSTSSTSDANNAAQATNINYGNRPASTAFAPSIPPTVNCASSFGAGAQGGSFGISFGGTPINVECERRELARTAMNFGDRRTAEEVLCGNGDYKAARERAGRPCAPDSMTVEEAAYTGNDPIVKRRLGMK